MAGEGDNSSIALSLAAEVVVEEVSKEASSVARTGEEQADDSPRSGDSVPANSPRKSDDGASSTAAGSSLASPIRGAIRWCDMESEASEDAFEGREEEDEEDHAERGAFLGPVVRLGEQKGGEAPCPQVNIFQENAQEVIQGVADSLRYFWCCSDVVCSWQSGTCCMQAVIPMEHVPYVQHLASAAKNAIVMRAAQSSSVCLLGCKAMPFVTTPTGFSATFGEMQQKEKACWDFYMYGQCRRGNRCTWQHATSTVTLNFMVMAVASAAPSM